MAHEALLIRVIKDVLNWYSTAPKDVVSSKALTGGGYAAESALLEHSAASGARAPAGLPAAAGRRP